MDTRDRLVPLSGAFNFRDLGGYRGLDGRTTRWGTLFRSDTLHELTQLTGSDFQVVDETCLEVSPNSGQADPAKC